MDYMKQARELVAKMTLREKCEQMVFNAPAIPRLNVPAYNWWNECLHGVGRAGCATVFPQAIAMAASWNPQLMEKVASAISDEARAKYNEYKKFGDTLIYQGLSFWSPNINIFRDPRWGRGHETYGEDPLLTGSIAVAFIKGLQGDDVNYRKVDATIKHYAVHSGPEIDRHSFNSIVNDEDLRETYLWAFKYCIDHANPAAVMGAYNRINGEPACASPRYLKGKLFSEWGFQGYTVSDCGAIYDLDVHHKVTATPMESAALAVNNGLHLNCGDRYKHLYEAVQTGMVTEEVVTESVTKLFNARFSLGMFSNDCKFDTIPYEIVECEKHRQLNIQMAQEGIVLLKNDGILPLSAQKKIAVIGPNADDRTVLLGNYNGTASRLTTILEGLQVAAPHVRYARGCHIYEEAKSWLEQPLREALIVAGKCDVIVLCLGLNPLLEGEAGDAFNSDQAGDKATLELPLVQQKLLAELSALDKPLVVINVSGSCVNLVEADARANAVVQVFYPGAEGGTAVADVLLGKVSPCGKLPVTFYRSTSDLPDFRNYSMGNRSYKFFKGQALYPFAHGLSYTKFNTELISCNGIFAKVTIKNVGEYDGAEVVTVFGKTVLEIKLNKRLLGFQKIFLMQGEQKEITITLCPEVLELFPDKNMIEFFLG